MKPETRPDKASEDPALQVGEEDPEVRREDHRQVADPGEANPRNPRHFKIIEGGRKRVSTTFMDKNSVSCA